jgi:hypothetical protein
MCISLTGAFSQYSTRLYYMNFRFEENVKGEKRHALLVNMSFFIYLVVLLPIRRLIHSRIVLWLSIKVSFITFAS